MCITLMIYHNETNSPKENITTPLLLSINNVHKHIGDSPTGNSFTDHSFEV